MVSFAQRRKGGMRNDAKQHAGKAAEAERPGIRYLLSRLAISIAISSCESSAWTTKSA